MKALLCRVTIPRFLLGQTLGRVWDYFLLGPGGFVCYSDMPKPTLRTPEYVRVKTTLTGICGSDTGLFGSQQHFSLEPYITFPAVPGHEAVGVVDQVGASVTRFKPGDRVALNPYIGCRERGIESLCTACQEGRPTRCANVFEGELAPGIVGFNKDLSGSWADYFTVPQTLLEPIPEKVTDEQAVLADPLVCALHGLLAAPPEPDQTVLVIGAGAIGLCLVAGLRALQYNARLLVQSRYDFQSNTARQLGADEIIADDKKALFRLADSTSARVLRPMVGPPVIEGGVDVVYDCVGSSSSLDFAFRATRSGGRVVIIGAVGQVKNTDLAPVWFREMQLTGVCGGGMENVNGEQLSTIQLALKLMEQDKLDLSPLLTHEFPMNQYTKALRVAIDHSQHKSIKVAMRPD